MSAWKRFNPDKRFLEVCRACGSTIRGWLEDVAWEVGKDAWYCEACGDAAVIYNDMTPEEVADRLVAGGHV